jgi:hypothetical protein
MLGLVLAYRLNGKLRSGVSLGRDRLVEITNIGMFYRGVAIGSLR